MTVHTVIVADDLTGAADAAAPLLGSYPRIRIVPWRDTDHCRDALRTGSPQEVLVIETDSRELAAEHAAVRLQQVGAGIRELAPHVRIIKKIDSRLRGPIGPELTALRHELRPPCTVVAPAFPAMGRITVNGAQHLADQLHSEHRDEPDGGRDADRDPTRAADPRPEPESRSLQEVCALPDAVTVVAGGHIPQGVDAIVDATSDRHLDDMAVQLLGRRPHPLLVGTGGLTAALARATQSPATTSHHETEPQQATTPREDATGILVVSLSPAPIALAQLERLAREPGTTVVALELEAGLRAPDRTVERVTDRLQEALARSPTTVLSISTSPTPAATAAEIRSAIMTMATAALHNLPAVTAFVANGGDATRCIIDAYDIRYLDVERRLPSGAALSSSDRGLCIATKSGSFGDPNGLHRVVEAVRASCPENAQHPRQDPL